MSTTQEQLTILKNRRHAKIAAKLDVWKLVSESYRGGETYLKGDHLFRHPVEDIRKFKARKKRGVYVNYLAPIVDILVGFIFSEEPKRDHVDAMKFFIEKATRKKSMNSFMETVALHSLLYTCGILVDSPAFDTSVVLSKADQETLQLQPYCVLYEPWKIIDFHTDDTGELLWVLLDNSYLDSTDPFTAAKTVSTYRLWTRTDYTDIVFDDTNTEKGEIKPPVAHQLGVVPFIFSSCRDIDEDSITETPCEDIALIGRSIYNTMSLLDEQVASGTFKVLFFPAQSRDDIPSEIKKAGLGALAVVPFNPESGGRPLFDGVDITNIAQVLSVIQIYIKAILFKVGLDKDDDKSFVQSGYAKKIEFQKTESLLRVFAIQLEGVEKRIFHLAGLWYAKTPGSRTDAIVTVTYPRQFQSEELEKQLSRLYDLYNLGFQSLAAFVIEKIIKKTFPELDEKTLRSLINDITQELHTGDKRLNASIDDSQNDELKTHTSNDGASQGTSGNEEETKNAL
jgi:hypothetical protein